MQTHIVDGSALASAALTSAARPHSRSMLAPPGWAPGGVLAVR